MILSEEYEKSLFVSKEYKLDFTYVYEKMAYTDVSVLFAKQTNLQSFKNYNDFINMDDKSKGKHVTDFGEVHPYEYMVVREELVPTEEEKTEIQKMYKNGDSLND